MKPQTYCEINGTAVPLMSKKSKSKLYIKTRIKDAIFIHTKWKLKYYYCRRNGERKKCIGDYSN